MLSRCEKCAKSDSFKSNRLTTDLNFSQTLTFQVVLLLNRLELFIQVVHDFSKGDNLSDNGVVDSSLVSVRVSEVSFKVKFVEVDLSGNEDALLQHGLEGLGEL